MPYITLNDLIAAFGEREIIQLSDRDGDGQVDQGVVDLVIQASTDEINTYLGGYDLPLPSVPGHLKTVASNISRYRMFTVAPEGEPKDRYDESIRWLRDVSSGRAELPGIDRSATKSSAPGIGRVRHGQAASRINWDSYP